jgi:hypothetical protein
MVRAFALALAASLVTLSSPAVAQQSVQGAAEAKAMLQKTIAP